MTDIREQLAAYAHEAWSGWMRYLFSKGKRNEDGTWTMPPWAVERWQRQMNMPYDDLPENERNSDRYEADKILAIVAAHPDGVCEWTYSTYFDTWETDCGAAWVFTEGPPSDNDVNYCPACGRPMVEAGAPEPTNPLRAKVVARGDEEAT